MTTIPAVLWNHRSVSERESAHYWPDGRWDNAAWEDCFWDSLIVFVRSTLRPSTPATHAEAEALRADSGEDTWSGSHSGDGNRGLRARYRLGPLETHSDADVLAMSLNSAAHVSGSMGAFPFSHRLRRWDADFRGFHRTTVFRVSGGTGWWWVDPLAPASHPGEWITRSDLQRCMAAFPGGDHYIERLLPRPAAPAPDPTPIARVRVAAGYFWLYDVSGNPTRGYAGSTRIRKRTSGWTADVGRVIERMADGSPVEWGGEVRRWAHVVDERSAYDDVYVDLNAGGVSLLVP